MADYVDVIVAAPIAIVSGVCVAEIVTDVIPHHPSMFPAPVVPESHNAMELMVDDPPVHAANVIAFALVTDAGPEPDGAFQSEPAVDFLA